MSSQPIYEKITPELRWEKRERVMAAHPRTGEILHSVFDLVLQQKWEIQDGAEFIDLSPDENRTGPIKWFRVDNTTGVCYCIFIKAEWRDVPTVEEKS